MVLKTFNPNTSATCSVKKKKIHPKSLRTASAEKSESLMRSSVQVSSGHLLGGDEGEELAHGLLLVLGRRGWRLVVLLTLAAGAAAGGEAVLPELLPDELVVDEGRAPEVGEHQPRDEQQLQLVPNRDPENQFQANLQVSCLQEQVAMKKNKTTRRLSKNHG
jgi:hypothetical protein